MRLNNDLPRKLCLNPDVERLFRKHFAEMSGGKLYLSREKPLRHLEGLLAKTLPDMIKRNFPGIKKVRLSSGIRN